MKDLLGIEIEAGDFIADVRTSGGGYKTVGIVEGGVTRGGSVRIFLIEQEKLASSKEKHLIKIEFETFQSIKNGLIDIITARRDEMIERYGNDNRTVRYWDEYLERVQNRYEVLLTMRREVYKK